MIHGGSLIRNAKVIVLGLTFKENCPDLRNSKVVDIVNEKNTPLPRWERGPSAMREYGIRLLDWESLPRADAVVAAVAHRSFLELGIPDIASKLIKGGCFIDVKAIFDAAQLKAAGIGV